MINTKTCKHCKADVIWVYLPSSKVTVLNARPTKIFALVPSIEGDVMSVAHPLNDTYGYGFHMCGPRPTGDAEDGVTKDV